jgi:hypothetical protein
MMIVYSNLLLVETLHDAAPIRGHGATVGT